jgi:ATP-binding cassette subfamily B multidrug efflux pump
VRDNIRYGLQNASENPIMNAVKQAAAHDFIACLQGPDGNAEYDAKVGERQRISLARVILKDATILLLNEATSALDSEVEAKIKNTLYGMMEGKTVIAIAHRLSTIAHMDRILVIDEGRIVEDGTHKALLAKDELCAGFWNG